MSAFKGVIMRVFACLAVAALSVVIAAPAVAESPTRVRLVASPSPSKAGQSVLLQAEVDGLGGGAPTGTVTFKNGSVVLGATTLSPKGAGQGVLAAGAYHTCALNSGGGVECWGANDYGQLGDGTYTERHAPVLVSDLAGGVVAVAAGDSHTCALTSAGGAKCWGFDLYGQLGDGSNLIRRTPVSVSGLSSGVIAITASRAHSCALTIAGAVKCWGANGSGQLGDGTTFERHTPVAVQGLSSGVVAISAGAYHTCALTIAGGVKCWGGSNTGQLGDGSSLQRLTPSDVSGLSRGVVAISARSYHTCALTSAGAVKCWGSNFYGEIGDGTHDMRYTPVAVSGLASGVVAIAAGASHSCAVNASGVAKCWGDNMSGQLGDGTATDRRVPTIVSGLSSGVVTISTGAYHSCALTIAGAVKCWGNSTNGQLGDGATMNRLTPTPVAGLTTLVRARARLATRSLTVGTHNLRAGFGGDASHSGSIGAVVQIVQ
jgi:alpha-tubulin suppressor-like RCC1 family protein